MTRKIILRTFLALRLLFHIGLFGTCGAVIWFVLIMGSGTSPVEPEMVLGILLALAVPLGAVVVWTRRWWAQLLPILLCLLIEVWIFGQLHYRAFELAKIYGADLAICVDKYNRENGAWPKSFQDIPQECRTVWPPKSIWPYTLSSDRANGGRWNIGGFFITYHGNAGVPELSVGRRETRVVWDWQKMAWKQTE